MRETYRTAILRGVMGGAGLFAVLVTFSVVVGINSNASAGVSVRGPRDCDSNAIMHCGALSTDELRTKYEANSTGDVHAIYSHFGISKADVDSLASNVAVGTISSNGDVTLDGRIIGVNAQTAGRNITARSSAIPGSTAYKRPPSDSFATPNTTIQIYIGFQDGLPSWGVITSCGNPVTWESPRIDVKKQVRKDGGDQLGNSVVAQSGDQLTFDITVTEQSGYADVQNVIVKDILPNEFEYVANTLRVQGRSQRYPESGMIVLGRLRKGETVTISFKVRITSTVCENKHVKNTVEVSGFGVAGDYDTAEVAITGGCEREVLQTRKELPSLPKRASCTALTVDRLQVRVGQKAYIDAEAAPSDAVNEGYVLVSNGHRLAETYSEDASSMWFMPKRTGSFTVTMYVKTVGGDESTSVDCKTTITAVADAADLSASTREVDVVSCDALRAEQPSVRVGEKLYLTIDASARDDSIGGYVLLSNGHKIAETYSETSNRMWFRPNQTGQFNLVAQAKSSTGAVTSAECTKAIEVV